MNLQKINYLTFEVNFFVLEEGEGENAEKGSKLGAMETLKKTSLQTDFECSLLSCQSFSGGNQKWEPGSTVYFWSSITSESLPEMT